MILILDNSRKVDILQFKMASSSKGPGLSNFSQEDSLVMHLEEDENHLGMSKDVESETDRELGH